MPCPIRRTAMAQRPTGRVSNKIGAKLDSPRAILQN